MQLSNFITEILQILIDSEKYKEIRFDSNSRDKAIFVTIDNYSFQMLIRDGSGAVPNIPVVDR